MKILGALGLAVLIAGTVGFGPAKAGNWGLGHNIYAGRQIILTQTYDDAGSDAATMDGGQEQTYPVSASEAAAIAKGSWPGAKVLKVQLLPSGVYAVTLKQGGEVSRIMVDATSGSIV